MKIFEGKIHAAKIDESIRNRLKTLKLNNSLLIVLIGDNPVSLRYIKVKMKLCEELGIPVILEHIDSNLSDDEIFSKIKKAFEDDSVSGGLIQLPLPRESLEKCLDLIPYKKDIDLISSKNSALYYQNSFNRLPPVVRAFNYFFQTVEKDKHRAVRIRILGNGFLVGKPLNQFLKSFENITVDNERFNNGDKITSDFLICGVGKPNMIRGQDISANCNVIDFGTVFVDGKVVGDLDKNSDCSHLGTVSFSPGGIGPVVVRFLILNFLDLCEI